MDFVFVSRDITGPAGAAFSIDFDNQDDTVPHNIDIKGACGKSIFKGEVITGPAKTTYLIPALAAGHYTFVCNEHLLFGMAGTLITK